MNQRTVTAIKWAIALELSAAFILVVLMSV